MVVTKEQKEIHLNVNDYFLESTENLNYLGAIFEHTGKVELYVNNRIIAKTRLYNSLRPSFLNIQSSFPL